MYGSADELQYMSWIRDEGRHLLAANLFDTVPDARIFAHPMFLFSGALTRIGLPASAAYLAWLPVAVASMWVGFIAYSRRFLSTRQAVLVAGFGLFYMTPVFPLMEWLNVGGAVNRGGVLVMALETFSANFLWGNFPTAISLGLFPLLLLWIERLILDKAPSQRLWPAATIGALVMAWLHPWQALVLGILVVSGLGWEIAVNPNSRPELLRATARLVPVGIGLAAPVAYYALLPSWSAAWARSAGPNSFHHLGLWLIALAPLAVLAAPGYLGRPATLGDRFLRLWPAAVVVAYFLLRRSFFYHVFEGTSLPLAVLAMRGAARLRLAPLALAAGALLVVPGLLFAIVTLDANARKGADFYIETDDYQALNYLREDAAPGAVLARYNDGKDVPAVSGRSTWVGNYEWTPDFLNRVARADRLVAGRMTPEAAAKFVADSGASFLLLGCADSKSLRTTLASRIEAEHDFGCAAVLRLRP